MQRIDAHQHFWNYDPQRDSWITPDMKCIARDFLPEDLQPFLHENQIDGCVAVQADQSEKETIFLLNLAAKHPFIKGVVGWVDLQSHEVESRLKYFSQFDKLKGFRHILQGEERRDLMLSEKFKKGIALLEKYSFTYDILVYPDQLEYAVSLANFFPGQKFVLDHIGKPCIKFKKTKGWEEEIRKLGACKNVWCKVSGLVTESDWNNWTAEDFTPYLDIVFESFGTDRLIFGSDWPVCNLAAAYSGVVKLIDDYLSKYTGEEREKIFGKNAVEFYNL